jgi:hypothetical protein
MEDALPRRAFLTVKDASAPLLGISGHVIGSLERAHQVLVHGELGPYTIVSYEGRNGYVLTESLHDPTAVEGPEEEKAETRHPAPSRLARVLVAVSSGGALVATGAAVLMAV